MPDFHGEPYIHLAGLTHDSALIAWGAFYFRVKAKGENYKLLDADDMEPALRETSRESPSSHEKLAGAENSRSARNSPTH